MLTARPTPIHLYPLFVFSAFLGAFTYLYMDVLAPFVAVPLGVLSLVGYSALLRQFVPFHTLPVLGFLTAWPFAFAFAEATLMVVASLAPGVDLRLPGAVGAGVLLLASSACLWRALDHLDGRRASFVSAFSVGLLPLAGVLCLNILMLARL